MGTNPRRARRAHALQDQPSEPPSYLAGTALSGRAGLAQVLWKGHDIHFALVPGGTFLMGIARAELEAALALTVAPFLCARNPLDAEGASALLEMEVEPDNEGVPLRFTGAKALQLWTCARAMGVRLISAPEWEYVVREGGPCGWQGGRTADECRAAHAALYNQRFALDDTSRGTTEWAMAYPWQSDEIAGCLSGMADSSGMDDYCVRFALDLPGGA